MTTLNPPKTDSITLYYRDGSSDKVYQCSIEPKDGQFTVQFAYGRRGSTLQTGSKTTTPVEYDAAKAIYDKLVREKMAKGYSPGEDGTPYQQTGGRAQFTGILPQLLNPIDENEARRLITDSDWCMQEKKDGRRILIKKGVEGIVGINRKGMIVGLPSPIIETAQSIGGYFVMDGECIGDVLHAFDLLERNEQRMHEVPFGIRLHILGSVLKKHSRSNIQLVETASTQIEKESLFSRLQTQKREGVVFKHLNAAYTAGRPNTGGAQLKYKFCATLSAVVSKLNAQRSVELRLLNGMGWIPVGNVTIPPNHAVPTVGTVVEIRYLYAFPDSKALFQPVYLGQRNDTEAHECMASQLKFKSDEDETPNP